MVKAPFVIEKLASKVRPAKLSWVSWENAWAAVVAIFVTSLLVFYVATIADSTQKAKEESSQVQEK